MSAGYGKATLTFKAEQTTIIIILFLVILRLTNNFPTLNMAKNVMQFGSAGNIIILTSCLIKEHTEIGDDNNAMNSAQVNATELGYTFLVKR